MPFDIHKAQAARERLEQENKARESRLQKAFETKSKFDSELRQSRKI